MCTNVCWKTMQEDVNKQGQGQLIRVWSTVCQGNESEIQSACNWKANFGDAFICSSKHLQSFLVLQISFQSGDKLGVSPLTHVWPTVICSCRLRLSVRTVLEDFLQAVKIVFVARTKCTSHNICCRRRSNYEFVRSVKMSFVKNNYNAHRLVPYGRTLTVII